MKIKLLCVGKTKEAWCAEGVREYAKRLAPFCELENIEVEEEKMSPSIAAEMVKRREGERLLSRVSASSFVVALSPDGKPLSSTKFAEFLAHIRDEKGGKLCFLIGGPLGLSEQVLKSADKILSFSQMTFPHDLFRVMLCEQIYRGFSILSGKKYHK